LSFVLRYPQESAFPAEILTLIQEISEMLHRVLLGLLASLLFVGCSGKVVKTLSPETVSESRINKEADKSYRQIVSESKLSRDKRLVEMVKRVGMRIAKASGEPFQWEIELIESPELNAWCMPGGKMAVYTGILPVLQTEGALAAVIGHEVAHATRRHGMNGYAKAIENQIATMAVVGVAAVASEFYCQTEQCKLLAKVGGAAGALGVAFFDRKFGRDDETDADRWGQIYMARAGYDPAEAIKVWERMAAATGGGGGPEFMSTHPSNENRRNRLSQWLPETRSIYEKAPKKYGVGEKLF
jgi:predicted Zn-dependent protease